MENNIDQMICDVVKRRYNIYIGLRTAEKIKIALADAIYSEDENNEDDILYVLEEMLLQDFHLKELLQRIQFARQLNRFLMRWLIP